MGLSSASAVDKGEELVWGGTLSICCCLVFSSVGEEGEDLVGKRGVDGDTSPEEREEMEAERPGGRGSISTRELEESWEGIWATKG